MHILRFYSLWQDSTHALLNKITVIKERHNNKVSAISRRYYISKESIKYAIDSIAHNPIYLYRPLLFKRILYYNGSLIFIIMLI